MALNVVSKVQRCRSGGGQAQFPPVLADQLTLFGPGIDAKGINVAIWSSGCPTLYNAKLRIAWNFLETQENIKNSTHPFYHVNLDRFS